MPRSVKSSKILLVSKSTPTGVEHLGAMTTFRSAYQWILFKGGIANPSLAERAALAKLRKEGVTEIYNSDKHESRESALWGQEAELYWIAEIPIIRN